MTILLGQAAVRTSTSLSCRRRRRRLPCVAPAKPARQFRAVRSQKVDDAADGISATPAFAIADVLLWLGGSVFTASAISMLWMYGSALVNQLQSMDAVELIWNLRSVL